MKWLNLNESIKTSSTYNVLDCLVTAGIEISQRKCESRDNAGCSPGWRWNTDVLFVPALRVNERILISISFSSVFSKQFPQKMQLSFFNVHFIQT